MIKYNDRRAPSLLGAGRLDSGVHGFCNIVQMTLEIYKMNNYNSRLAPSLLGAGRLDSGVHGFCNIV